MDLLNFLFLDSLYEFFNPKKRIFIGYLLIAVLIGGQIGNFLNLKIFPTRLLALVTSLLVLFVSVRMGFRLFI